MTTAPATISWAGVVDGVVQLSPVAIFAAVFGAAFGAAAIEAGLSATTTLAMSASVFAGVSQFAALEIWADPPPIAAIAFVVLLANLRHIVFGAALSSVANALPLGSRLMAMSVVSDANYTLAKRRLRAGSRDLGPMVGGGAALWAAWVLGTALGVAAGSFTDDLGRYGVDVVMMGFFTALLIGDLDRLSDATPLAAAALAGAACVIFGVGAYAVVVAVVAGVAVEMLRMRKGDDEVANGEAP